MLDAKDPTQPLFGYAPGTATCICTCCRAVHEADPRAIQCHRCACKLLDYRMAGIDTRQVVPQQDWNDASATLNPALALFVAEFASMLDGAGNALEEKRTLDQASKAPKVGTRVRIGGMVGEVCAPNDPRRSGTYTSAKYGELPVRLLGNRKQRRAAEAKERGR